MARLPCCSSLIMVPCRLVNTESSSWGAAAEAKDVDSWLPYPATPTEATGNAGDAALLLDSGFCWAAASSLLEMLPAAESAACSTNSKSSKADSPTAAPPLSATVGLGCCRRVLLVTEGLDPEEVMKLGSCRSSLRCVLFGTTGPWNCCQCGPAVCVLKECAVPSCNLGAKQFCIWWREVVVAWKCTLTRVSILHKLTFRCSWHCSMHFQCQMWVMHKQQGPELEQNDSSPAINPGKIGIQ